MSVSRDEINMMKLEVAEISGELKTRHETQKSILEKLDFYEKEEAELLEQKKTFEQHEMQSEAYINIAQENIVSIKENLEEFRNQSESLDR